MTRVLIVDDERSVRWALADIVEAEGLESVEAGDGAAALEIVREQVPDVILLDDAMPNLDGIGFLKALRADPTLGRPAVIMVTAKAGSDDEHRAIERRLKATFGIVDFISKPWMPGEIGLRLKWALKTNPTVPAVPENQPDAEKPAAEELANPQSVDSPQSSGQWSSLNLPEGSGTEIITPEDGGSVETKDGKVRVTLPAGAVPRTMALSASPAPVDTESHPASLRVWLGDQATDLTFSDRTGSPVMGVRLDRPAEITLKFDPETIENADDPSAIQAQELDGNTREWTDLPARVDLKNGVVKVRKLEFPPLEHERMDATVLVISDSESEQEALRENLETAGYDVLIEADPNRVNQRIIDERPEVVLLEIAMRRLNGISILRQIKGDPNTRQVAVITLGQEADHGEDDNSRSDYAQSVALGARGMIILPWRPGDLQALVAGAVEASRARASQAERAVARAKTRRKVSRRKTRRPTQQQARQTSVR